jgi:outer membrane protein assembly factor BamB
MGLLTGACAAIAVLAACTTGASTGSPTASGVTASSATAGTSTAGTGASAFPAAAWPTYDQNIERTGVAAGVRRPGKLSVAWRDALDGSVYGQPLLIGGLVVVATENDTVYALDNATGAVAWHTHVGTPVPQGALHGCGDIFPLGITGTPAYDQSDGLVYAVAETTGYRHVLFGLSATSGAIKVERDIPTPDGQDAWDQQRPALTITGGRVYVMFGGLAGDCGPYRGSIAGVPVSGSGPIISYVTPTPREGAFWGPGGVVAGPASPTDPAPTLYGANGNGAAEQGDPYDYSDSVTHLTLGLRRIGFFAPSSWALDNAQDQDLGSTQPTLASGGSVFAVGKRGAGYLLRLGALGGIGGQVAQADICQAYGTAAVSGGTIYEPCTDAGLTAVAVSAAAKEIKVLWRGPADAHGSAAIGGGAIWVPDSRDGILYALAPATGAVLQSVHLGEGMPRFSSVSLGETRAYVGTSHGVVAVSGA